MSVTQFLILILGAVSIGLLASPYREVRKLGYIAGLASEPFWFWASASSRQWGVFALCAWYTAAYLRGWWNHRGGVA